MKVNELIEKFDTSTTIIVDATWNVAKTECSMTVKATGGYTFDTPMLESLIVEECRISGDWLWVTATMED